MSHESLTYVFESLRPEPGVKRTLSPEKCDALDETLASHSLEDIQAALDVAVTAGETIWIDNGGTTHEMPLSQYILQRKKYLNPAPPSG